MDLCEFGIVWVVHRDCDHLIDLVERPPSFVLFRSGNASKCPASCDRYHFAFGAFQDATNARLTAPLHALDFVARLSKAVTPARKSLVFIAIFSASPNMFVMALSFPHNLQGALNGSGSLPLFLIACNFVPMNNIGRNTCLERNNAEGRQHDQNNVDYGISRLPGRSDAKFEIVTITGKFLLTIVLPIQLLPPHLAPVRDAGR